MTGGDGDSAECRQRAQAAVAACPRAASDAGRCGEVVLPGY